MTTETLLERDFGLIPELIGAHARTRPAHPALVEGAGQLSFGELDLAMDQVAAALQRDGLLVGDVIAIGAATSLSYALVFLGALRAGVAVAPLAPSSSADSLVAMLRDCGAKLLFADASFAATLASASTLGTRAEALATLPAAVTPIALDGSAVGRTLESWLAPAGSQPQPVSIRPNGVFNIIYSSGTTGVPKGIVQPNLMRWAHVRRGADIGYGPDAVTLVSTPLYSNTTLVSFFPGLALGGTVVLLRKFDAETFLQTAVRHGVTHAMLVPVQYQRLLDFPAFDSFDLSRFRMKFCTSAPFGAALKAQILARWPGGLIEYYGMTEGGGTCVLAAHLHPNKLHTVGQPAPEHDIRLIDEAGRELPRGEVGEVVGRSALAMMLGYHEQPDKTRDAEWYDAAGRRFIRTGDVGRFDEDGFLTLLDRKKDMIISGGFNLYPSDLEAELVLHPAVAEAAVFGVPSRQWGETPVACVVRRTGHDDSAEQIRAWVNERVGKTQRLSALELVDSLPRSAIGKVLKRELRDRYAAAAGDTL